jgi:hypothetical protein
MLRGEGAEAAGRAHSDVVVYNLGLAPDGLDSTELAGYILSSI